MLWLLLILILLSTIYLWLKQKQNYWIKRNIQTVPESIYFYGRNQHIAHYLQDIYNVYKFSKTPFIGIFVGFSPTALVYDLNLLKTIFINNFDNFPDRGFYSNPHDDPLSGNIVRLEGEAWKSLRAKLTPTFSSGKMKLMLPTIVEIAERLATVMHEMQDEIRNQEKGYDIRDLCARFTTDVIGSVAYGFDCNSLREPNTEFRLKGDKAFKSFNLLVEVLGTRYTKLFHKLHIKAFPKELIEFYSKIMIKNIEFREKNDIKRNDFLDILIELKNTIVDGKPVLTLDEVIAQAFVFFIGGFETSSSTMTFCLYELSKNQNIQEKVRQNVLETLAKHENQLTYECMKDMSYVQQTILETLRLYPIAPTLKRVTRKDYHLPNSSIVLERDVHVMIPVYAIHKDPEYYPDPETFDPDRFLPNETKNRHPMAYLPFGAGPRVCIAERFGKMQTHIGIAILLKNFKFSLPTTMPKTLEYNTRNLRLFQAKGGIWLNAEPL